MRNKIQQIAGGHVPARILLTANRLGLFRVLSPGLRTPSLTAGEIARRMRTDRRVTERLLNALVSMQLLGKRNRHYRIVREAVPYLSPEGSESLCRSFTLQDTLWPVWEDLDLLVRRGRPALRMMDRIKKDKRVLKHFIHGMRDRAAQAAGMIQDHIDFRKVRTFLDLGAGPGIYSLEWLRAYPHLSGTVFDVPDVIPITRGYIRSYGLRKKTKVMMGDFIRDPIGKGYDLILLANILQMYGPSDGRRLLRKAFLALNPGGQAVIHGFMTDKTGTVPRESATFGMTIALFTPSGHAYPVPEVSQWLRSAGFKKLRIRGIDVVPPTLLIATKKAE